MSVNVGEDSWKQTEETGEYLSTEYPKVPVSIYVTLKEFS